MHILLVIADFYHHITVLQEAGAYGALEQEGVTYDVVRVPGALEIPPAISFAATSKQYDGYVALGCVIRGETTHYETVCNESARGLMLLGTMDKLAIGNGILTVENEAQAIVRADPAQKNKGGDAVAACLALVALQQRFTHGEAVIPAKAGIQPV
jgi:6,7-dimethyl-8-ribityllumazine synthase